MGPIQHHAMIRSHRGVPPLGRLTGRDLLLVVMRRATATSAPAAACCYSPTAPLGGSNDGACWHGRCIPCYPLRPIAHSCCMGISTACCMVWR